LQDKNFSNRGAKKYTRKKADIFKPKSSTDVTDVTAVTAVTTQNNNNRNKGTTQ
jgi:hypothetical protein